MRNKLSVCRLTRLETLDAQGPARHGSLFSTVSKSNLSADLQGGFSLTGNTLSATLTPLLYDPLA
ncbi:hypothetical protein EMIT0196MI5_30007 [Pseudomonas sp. IT-196MI5]